MILSRLATRAPAFGNSYEFPFSNPNNRNPHLAIHKSEFGSIFNHPISLHFRPAKKWHRNAIDKPGTKGKKQQKQDEDEEDFHVLTAIKSNYNDIVILDTPKSLVLLLDSTQNVHSIINKGDDHWTGSYWDDFASLPAIIIPSHQNPIAIFGLGGGTAAHLMLSSWPSLRLQGWEIDEILIDKAREYMGLSGLEKPNEQGGVLDVRFGDVLTQEASFPGGYSGIVVDLFANGKVLPELEEVETWLGFRDRLMPNGGRIMVNCGGASSNNNEHEVDGKLWELNDAIRAMCKAFPGELCWKKTPESEGDNYLALTGPFPDLDLWSQSVPGCLKESVKKWRPCT